MSSGDIAQEEESRFGLMPVQELKQGTQPLIHPGGDIVPALDGWRTAYTDDVVVILHIYREKAGLSLYILAMLIHNLNSPQTKDAL
jgi:hypothetical protein